MKKKPMKAPHVLNEAYCYDRPVPFARGTRVDIRGVTMLFISGTASVNENGESIHEGDFAAQANRMLDNVTELLKAESATWQDVVKTTFFVKHMEENYYELAEIRTKYLKEHGVEEFSSSTCIQATLCRPELLVEMEAIAILDNQPE